jgi:predicted nucleic acid-binding protein
VIVADTSAMLALLNANDAQHDALLRWYDADGEDWILPWAILPEVDYLLSTRATPAVQMTFMEDVAEGRYVVEWGAPGDMRRAATLARRYRSLALGLVDAMVMTLAERLRADAIATLDFRHFGVVKLATEPLLLPRDG